MLPNNIIINGPIPMNPFVESAVEDLKASFQEPHLRADFEREWRDRIESLYKDYLRERALYERTKERLVLRTSLDDTGMSTRTVNTLMEDGIKTVADLVQYSVKELYGLRNVGTKAVEEVCLFLAKHDLHLVESDVRTKKISLSHGLDKH